MMKTSEPGSGDDCRRRRRPVLDGALVRRVFCERIVNPILVVIRDVFSQFWASIPIRLRRAFLRRESMLVFTSQVEAFASQSIQLSLNVCLLLSIPTLCRGKNALTKSWESRSTGRICLKTPIPELRYGLSAIRRAWLTRSIHILVATECMS
jgi:hypothetical protein